MQYSGTLPKGARSRGHVYGQPAEKDTRQQRTQHKHTSTQAQRTRDTRSRVYARTALNSAVAMRFLSEEFLIG